MRIRLHDKYFVPFIHNMEIQLAVNNIAEKINIELKGSNPLFLVVLNGAFVFAADLLRKIRVDCEVSFVKLASYQGTSSTGKVRSLIGLNENIVDRNIIVVEDIVDSGLSMHYLLEEVKKMNPHKLFTASLLLKPDALKKKLDLDYVGLEIPDEFIVGYGLDYNGHGRNLQDIYVLDNSS